jgi:WD40 repeat protein
MEFTMTNIFISYSRRNKEFTQQLVDALIAANREVWADWQNIPAAADWDAEIKEGIRGAESVLFLLSPEWLKSPECRKELDYALLMGKRLITILHQPIEYNDLPPDLKKINWIDMSNPASFDVGFQTVCTALDTDLDWIKAHTRIQVRAVEWDKKNRDNSFTLRGKDLTDGERFLAGAADKNPAQTPLQSEYILASRKDATRRQRITLGGVTVALVVSIVLAVLAWFQWQAAVAAEATAVVERDRAVVAQNTAVAAEAAAVANELEAKRQADISRAGDLAGQATILRDTDLVLSLLLGVEAYNLQDNYRTRVSLLDNMNVQPRMISTLVKHSSWVKDVAFSTDGSLLATSSCANYNEVKKDCSQGEFILWDMDTDHPSPMLFTGHSGWIYTVAFDPDPNEKILATAGEDNNIIFWDVEAGNQIGQMPSVHSNGILRLAFSPNRRYLVSGDGNGLIVLWDLQAQTHKELFRGEGPIKTLAVSPDSQVLAFGNCSNFDNKQIVKCNDPTINLLSLETGKLIGGPLQGHQDLIETIAFSPSGKILASGSDDNTVILWKIDDLEKIQPIGEPLTGHLDWVYSVVFIDEDLLASASVDGTVALWDTQSLKNVDLLTGHSDWVTRLAISPDKRILASASDDKTIILWDAQGNRKPFGDPLEVPNLFPFSIGFDPGSGILASGIIDREGRVLFWDINKRSQVSGVINTSSIPSALAYSLDGKRFATGGSDGTIMYWNFDPQTPTLQGQSPNGHSDLIFRLSFSNDGSLLASTSLDGVGNIWDLNTEPMMIKQTLNLLNEYAESSVLIFSPSDRNLIAYGSENNVVLRNMDTQKEETYPGLLDTVTDIAFSPDGKMLAASSYGNIILLDLSADEKRAVPFISQTGNIGEIWRITFSPDGKTLVSSGCGTVDSQANCIENQIYLWDVESTQLIGSIALGEKTPSPILPFALAFSPDGKYLVSAGCTEITGAGCTKGQLYLWIIAPERWIENSCGRAGRNLTRAEWEKFGFTEPYRQTCDQWPLEPTETATLIP